MMWPAKGISARLLIPDWSDVPKLPSVFSKRRLTHSAVIVLPGILICLGIEWGARLWISQHTAAAINDMDRASYVDQSFYTQEFLREMRAFDGTWRPNDVGLSVAINIHGKYLNTDGAGYRITVGQLSGAKNSIYIFGSSVTFGEHLPDWLTLSSRLQGLIPSYRVVSQAAIGSSVEVQLNRLRQLDLRKGDIVLWFDGYADIEASFLSARARYREKWPTWILDGNLALFKAISINVEQGVPPELANDNTRQSAISRVIQYVDTVTADAGDYVRSHGASFYSFIEPSILFKPMTAHEQVMWTNQEPGQTQYMEQAWSELGASAGQIDLGHILSDQADVMFLDCCHMNDLATQMTAQAVFVRVCKINGIGNPDRSGSAPLGCR